MQISTGGGSNPLWSRDGRELLYQTLDRHVMGVSYTVKGDLFAAGTPRLWTKAQLRNVGYLSSYDLAPDGKRLAAIVADEVFIECELSCVLGRVESGKAGNLRKCHAPVFGGAAES